MAGRLNNEAEVDVSVIVANYNGEKFLADAIHSACNQSLRNIEVIVSDDASTDSSVQIIKALAAKDSRIRLVESNVNGGPAAARNRALDIAGGRWISVLDSDDLMHPDRLLWLIDEGMKTNADIVADDLLFFDTDHRTPSKTLLVGRWSKAPCWVGPDDYLATNNFYGKGPALGYLKPIFRASIIEKQNLRYDERLTIAEDYNFVFQLLMAGAAFRTIPNPGYFYRRHAGSISHRLNPKALRNILEAEKGRPERWPQDNLQPLFRARERSIRRAVAFEELVQAIKARQLMKAAGMALTDPGAACLLRLPLAQFFKRLRSGPKFVGKGSISGISEFMITDASKLYGSACVDVLIATWNSSGTIERAVQSALSDDQVSRVIVVDDGSTDGTFSLVDAMRERIGGRLVLQRLDQNQGPSAARNCGLELSAAPWVAILDGDDYFRPGRMRALLDASDGADFVADDHIQVKEGEDPALYGEALIGHDSPMTLDFATFVANNISKGGRLRKEFGFLKPMMRRSFLETHQLRYAEELRLGEDFALYARALAAGAVFRVIPSRTYVSVIRQDSLSGNHSKRDLECLRESARSLQALPNLTKPERELARKHFESVDARIQWLNVIDAVKARSAAAFLAPFFRRWTTSLYLIRCLLEQVMIRSKRSLGLP